MSVQVRNASMVSLLEADFIKRNEPGNLLGNIISTYQALPGLRGFWPMSSVDENGDVYDLTAQGRTLTNINTVTFANTDFLPYAEFDGSTNYLTRADEGGLDITGDITVGAWVRFNNPAGSAESIIGKWYTSGNQRSFAINRQVGGQFRFFVSANGLAATSSISTSVSVENTWYFCAGRLNTGNETSVFFNNEKTNLGSGIASIFNSSAPLEMGARELGSYLDGDMKLSFLCTSALPDNMINNLYQQARVLFENQ